jgi:FixJ family two-component response regulator
MNESVITCYIIDDDLAIVNRLKLLLSHAVPRWNVIGFTDTKRFYSESIIHKPDVLFVDVEMPECSGFELLRRLRIQDIFPVAVIITGHLQYATKAFKEDVTDYLLKPIDFEDLKETCSRIIDKISANPNIEKQIGLLDFLTPKEKRVLNLLTLGKTSEEVSNLLFVSKHTVNTHRSNILKKMDCSSLIQVINKLINN